MKKKILLILFLVMLLVPISVTCGNFTKSCATAPDSDGYIHRSVSHKPLIVVIVDLIFNSDISLVYYKSTTNQLVGQ